LDSVDPNGLNGEWQIEFTSKFVVDPEQAAAHDALRRSGEDRSKQFAELERQRTQLWPKLLDLEPELQSLFDRLRAGVIGANDLWLTYFDSLLQPLVGPNRQEDGDQLLFSEEALDAALDALYHEAGAMYRDVVLRRADWREGRANG
jgi:hypothetical protein